MGVITLSKTLAEVSQGKSPIGMFSKNILGIGLDPLQEKFLCSTMYPGARMTMGLDVRIFRAGRRVGKTTALLISALYQCLTVPDTITAFCTPYNMHTNVLFRDQFLQHISDKVIRLTEKVLQFTNNSQIRVVCDTLGLRGLNTDLLLIDDCFEPSKTNKQLCFLEEMLSRAHSNVCSAAGTPTTSSTYSMENAFILNRKYPAPITHAPCTIVERAMGVGSQYSNIANSGSYKTEVLAEHLR